MHTHKHTNEGGDIANPPPHTHTHTHTHTHPPPLKKDGVKKGMFNFLLNNALNTFYVRLYGVGGSSVVQCLFIVNGGFFYLFLVQASTPQLV